MRRKDREVTDFNRMREIAEECDCCRLGFRDGEEVYIVPLSFGVEEEKGSLVLYFHSASEGRKISLAENQPCVSFEMDGGYVLKPHESQACKFSCRYQSIMGKGVLSFVRKDEEKQKALQSIMRHYTGKCDWEFSDHMVENVTVLKLAAEVWTCKESADR